jgi:hypothetical protein
VRTVLAKKADLLVEQEQSFARLLRALRCASADALLGASQGHTQVLRYRLWAPQSEGKGGASGEKGETFKLP